MNASELADSIMRNLAENGVHVHPLDAAKKIIQFSLGTNLGTIAEPTRLKEQHNG